MADKSEAPFLFFVDSGDAAKLRDTSTSELAHNVANDAARGDLGATSDSIGVAANALEAFAEPGRTLGPMEAARLAHLAHRALTAVAASQGAEVYVQFVVSSKVEA